MNVLIYGSGAVGLAVGSCLLKSGQAHVTFLTRPGSGEELRTQGISRTGVLGSFDAAPSLLTVVDDDASLSNKSFDYLLACTKTFESESAAKIIAARNIKSPAIVLFHNGWGSSEIFARYLPRETINDARVMSGFRRIDKRTVEITVHADDVYMGSLYDGTARAKLEPLAAAIRAGGLPCTATDDIQSYIWSKMLFNCALNPLGALLGVRYGLLGESEQTRTLINRVLDEIYQVMAHHGFHAKHPTAAAYKDAFYGKMIIAAAAHESSMLQDLRAGRRTETDFLSGAIGHLGRQAGIATPTNDTLHEMIQFMEKQKA